MTFKIIVDIINIIDESSLNIGTINPFRYRSYYYNIETKWYYLNSRFYNPKLGRFVTMDEVEYLGASGSLLSYNLYSYCEGNPICYSDESGNDAIYVVDFKALPVVGHAILYYQYDGKWYKTEFTGFNFDKKTAKIYNSEVSTSIESELNKSKRNSIYLKGDYSKVYEYADMWEGYNYNGYNLIDNNL